MGENAKPYNGYVGENVALSFCSDLGIEDGESLIDERIVRVDAEEYKLKLTLSSGRILVVEGHMWDGCALNVGLEDPKPVKEVVPLPPGVLMPSVCHVCGCKQITVSQVCDVCGCYL